jgi:hypothetical protein
MITVSVIDHNFCERKYPYVGKLITEGKGTKLVLFTKEETGMVIYNDVDPVYSPVWNFSDDWDESCFEIFHGVVKLSS